MKIRWWILVVIFALYTGEVLAQNWSNPALTVNVPFSFAVNGTTLPQGQYAVRAHVTGHLLMIENTDDPQHRVQVFNNNAGGNPGKYEPGARMVFTQTNGQQVLHEIIFAGDDHIHDVIHGNDVAELGGN
jgi:hypothetical protein